MLFKETLAKQKCDFIHDAQVRVNSNMLHAVWVSSGLQFIAKVVEVTGIECRVLDQMRQHVL